MDDDGEQRGCDLLCGAEEVKESIPTIVVVSTSNSKQAKEIRIETLTKLNQKNDSKRAYLDDIYSADT